MAIKFQDKETGAIDGLRGGDPKLKQPLVRSSPFDPKGGKVINELEAEIRTLKKLLGDKGQRIVELEQALEASSMALIGTATERDNLNERVLSLEAERVSIDDTLAKLEDRLKEAMADRDKAWSTGAKVAEGLASELVDKKPWEVLGISYRTYYNRKKAGKL